MYLLSIISFLFVFASPVLADNFMLNVDGSVADLSSGLVWQGSSVNFNTSHSAANYCNQIRSTTPSAWRLPTRSELANLDRSLWSNTPAIYWTAADSVAEEGLYCFGDGAYFPSPDTDSEALARCVSDNPFAPVIEAIHVWVESWQNGDVEGYLASYVPEFQPETNIDHTAWEEQRRQRLSTADQISIKLKTEEITPLTEQSVEILFLQDYRSSQYQDQVRKRLLLRQQQGRWLIAKEEQLSSLPQQPLSAAAIYYH